MRDLPNWIQAVADLALAGITGWTLLVLRRYAADTKIIAKNSSEQIETAQKPFVTLVLGKDPSTPWVMRNQGSGTALNIYFTRYVGEHKPPIMQWMTPMAPGEECTVPRESGEMLQRDGFTVEYESLSGRKYRTVSKRTGDDLKTTFHDLR